jgi:hypothetical protein
MTTDFSMAASTSLAASVAPEDLKRGDYVAVLNEIIQFPSFLWFDSSLNSDQDIVRTRWIPTESGTPLKVKAICLPFVLVKSPFRVPETIDVRRVQLVRLNDDYARQVRKDLRKQHKQPTAACLQQPLNI